MPRKARVTKPTSPPEAVATQPEAVATQSVPGKPTSVECSVPIKDLKPHPRNYKAHPEDQLTHIRASLAQYGFYRRVVIANDNTILAGHGLVQAARGMDFPLVPAMRFSFGPDDPRALKLVAVDNEIGRFGEVDDRALTELLRDLSKDSSIDGLLGTGFDEQMLSALLMVTRPQSEVATFDAASEWTGMPAFSNGTSQLIALTLKVQNVEDRAEAIAKLGLDPAKGRLNKEGNILTLWYPARTNDDLKSVAWVEPQQEAEPHEP